MSVCGYLGECDGEGLLGSWAVGHDHMCGDLRL